jgi:hypothetical protein
MMTQISSSSRWQRIPVLNLLASEWQVWQKERTLPHYSLAPLAQNTQYVSPYALDMQPLLALPFGHLDDKGVLYNLATKKYPAMYHPTSIAQYALALWNSYLNTGDEKQKDAFIIQARWLVMNEILLDNNAGGWPMSPALHEYNTQATWLSALTQGNAISVLIRAYQLTKDEVFLQVARRAVRTFELEIRDGGIAVSLSNNGVFFEEVASYPAAHILNGYILALFGLYDYVAYTDDANIDALIKRSLTTLHTLINEFDIGYWSCYDLRFRNPSPLFYQALHVTLLEALARFSGCQHCAALAARWDRYQHSHTSRLHYFITSRFLRAYRAWQRKFPSSLSMKPAQKNI